MGNLVKIGSEFLVNSTEAGRQITPSIAALVGGGFVATWVDAQTGPGTWTVKAQVFDASGTKSGDELTVGSTNSYIENGAVAGLSGGGFVVTWRLVDDVVAQVFDAGGGAVGKQLNIGTQVEPYQSVPVVAGLDNDHFALAWTEANPTFPHIGNVKTQVFDGSGAKIGNETTVSSDSNAPHITALASGGFAIDFTTFAFAPISPSSYRIYNYNEARFFTASGRQVGFGIQPDTAGSGIVAGGPIAGLAGGGFVTGWKDGNATNSPLKLQLFDSGGGAIGSSFTIDASPAQSTNISAIGALNSGGFVAVWTAYGATSGDTSFASIRAQVYDASGTPQGDEFVVNTETLDSQLSPTITVLSNDNFVISWQNNNETDGDNDPSSIKAQIFTPPSPPTISSDGGGATAAITLGENGTAVTTVTATDTDAAAIFAYSIDGGDDASLFAIDARTGALRFVQGPDFEQPADSGLNNVYDVIVRVSTGSYSDRQALAITVANVNEAPTITTEGGGDFASITLAENNRVVTRIEAADPDFGAVLKYSIAGGADAAMFAINSATGELRFRASPDFEAPTDSGGDNVYDVVVRVSDGVRADRQKLAIAVSDTFDEVLTGTNRDDTLIGAAGNDRLDGLRGADRMEGGGGNDRYYVDNVNDRVIEAVDAGLDTVRSTISLVLAPEVENLTLTGTLALSGTGNALANKIVGNAGANLLSGLAGADQLSGGAGADRLDGGAGRDVLIGGKGADQFLFSSAPVTRDPDRVMDFSSVDGDKLVFSASAFTALGAPGAFAPDAFHAASGATRAQDANDRLIYDTATGRLFYDDDGLDGHAAVWIAVLGSNPALNASDIAIIA